MKILALFLLVCVPNTSSACRLALVLAMDVSKSMNSMDYALQYLGLARAFQDKEIRAAILKQGGPVAVLTFEWSSPRHQEVVSDWIILSTHRDIDRLAVRLERQQRTDMGHQTAIGSALSFAHQTLEEGPDCKRRVIDISSDGYNNSGQSPSQVYDALDFSQTIVNALVISGRTRPSLQRYYETDVIRGPGAFTIGTRDITDYPAAIRKKLLRELKPNAVTAAVYRD